MLDILFNQKDRFSMPDLVSQYVSLLSLLVRTFPDFRMYRGENSWEVVCRALALDYSSLPSYLQNSDDPPRAPLEPLPFEETLRLRKDAYNAACAIADTMKNVKLPFDTLFAHIGDAELASSALDLMMFGKMKMDEFRDPKFISSLLHLARNSCKATLILMKLAEDKGVAGTLIETKNSTWMERGNPDLLNTLRLFLVVFQNESIRPTIASLDSFYRFLHQMLSYCREINSTEVFSIMGTIVRRIPLSKEIMDSFS